MENKDWWKIFGTFPIVAKIRNFLLEKDLHKAMTAPENVETSIKKYKEESDLYKQSISIALLIEASCESSFQFFFQTLYR